MNHDEARELVEIASANYQTVLNPQTVDVWASTFVMDSADKMATALALWIEEEERFPTPAGLRHKARAEARRAAMTTGAPAIEAPRSGPGRLLGPEEGLPIAYSAYCAEVRGQGREPKPFDEFCKQVPNLRFTGAQR